MISFGKHRGGLVLRRNRYKYLSKTLVCTRLMPFGVFRDILEHLDNGAEAKLCRTRVMARTLRALMANQRTGLVQRHSIYCREIELEVLEANVSLHRR